MSTTSLMNFVTPLRKYLIDADDSQLDYKAIVFADETAQLELINSFSESDKTNLLECIASDCNWYADDHKKTIKFTHLLMENGADVKECSPLMERIIEWFGMDKLAYDEYNYLISKGFDCSCLNKATIFRCIRDAHVEPYDEEESKEDDGYYQTLIVNDLKNRMGISEVEDEVDATLETLEAALRDYCDFNYVRQGNSFISKYDVQGKKIKISVEYIDGGADD
jgi:hypothetical protein